MGALSLGNPSCSKLDFSPLAVAAALPDAVDPPSTARRPYVSLSSSPLVPCALGSSIVASRVQTEHFGELLVAGNGAPPRRISSPIGDSLSPSFLIWAIQIQPNGPISPVPLRLVYLQKNIVYNYVAFIYKN